MSLLLKLNNIVIFKSIYRYLKHKKLLYTSCDRQTYSNQLFIYPTNLKVSANTFTIYPITQKSNDLNLKCVTYLLNISLIIYLSLLPSIVIAQTDKANSRYNYTRKETSYSKAFENSKIRSFNIPVSDSLTVKLKTSRNFKNIGRSIVNSLESVHTKFERLLGKNYRNLNVTIKLIEPEFFYSMPEVPSWTNAIFYKGEITIPIDIQHLDLNNIARSVRHEYLHALVSFRSRNRCPGWIDEGLAQLAEGRPHPSLKRALIRWARKYPLIPLESLQGGFTELAKEKVAPAYAQSLFGVKLMLNRSGYKALGIYLDELSAGADEEISFRKIFKITKSSLMNLLLKKIKNS